MRAGVSIRPMAVGCPVAPGDAPFDEGYPVPRALDASGIAKVVATSPPPRTLVDRVSATDWTPGVWDNECAAGHDIERAARATGQPHGACEIEYELMHPGVERDGRRLRNEIKILLLDYCDSAQQATTTTLPRGVLPPASTTCTTGVPEQFVGAGNRFRGRVGHIRHDRDHAAGHPGSAPAARRNPSVSPPPTR
jgi:hypothetical protein